MATEFTIEKGMKRCCTCKREKPLKQFGGNRSTKDGLQYFCRTCQTAHDKKRRHARNMRQRRYVMKHPEIIKAHGMAWNRRDRLRKTKCEHCGSTERLHMHHPDYAKPIEVITLCGPCHEKTHSNAQTDAANKVMTEIQNVLVRHKAALLFTGSREAELWINGFCIAYVTDVNGKQGELR